MDAETPFACPKCGSVVFWFVTVAARVTVSAGRVRFVAEDADANREAGFRCYECDAEPDIFDSPVWHVEATEQTATDQTASRGGSDNEG